MPLCRSESLGGYHTPENGDKVDNGKNYQYENLGQMGFDFR